jgi:hypothetical protein
MLLLLFLLRLLLLVVVAPSFNHFWLLALCE